MDAPRTIAHYRILAMLGEGGMGAVYRATDTKLNREVAIKILPEAFANDPERFGRFTREAQILAGLNHPNIATIYGVEEQAIIMELVQGQPPVGPLDSDQAHTLIHQLIDALEYAHDKGIVHRDLKPANLILSTDGRLKVLDFGIAKALSVDASRPTDNSNSPTLTIQSTTVGMVMGTAAYMAPEQAKGQTVDKRADIWSFGVVVYELLTGKRLFEGESVSDILAAVLRQDIETTAIPARYRKLLNLCLTRDPNKRLRDISGARLLLEETPAPPPAVKNGLPIWASVLPALVVALLAGGWILTRPKPIRSIAEFYLESSDESQFQGLAVSSDGTRIATTKLGEGGTARIYIRRLDSTETSPLAGTEGASLPVWSPDDKKILFLVAGKTLKTIELETGAVQTIHIDRTAAGTFQTLSWSPNGSIYAWRGAPGGLKIDSNGGPPVEFSLSAQGIGRIRFQQFLPDGNRALIRVTQQSDSLWLASFDGSAPTLLLKNAASAAIADGNLIFARDGQVFAQPFDSAKARLGGEPVKIAGMSSRQIRGGASTLAIQQLAKSTSTLNWVARDGKASASGMPEAEYFEITLSPDESRLLYRDTRESVGNLWTLDLNRGLASKLTFQNADRAPIWSPDGQRIVFMRDERAKDKSNKVKIITRAADGTGGETILSQYGEWTWPVSWSADGRWILILKERDLHFLSAGGDGKTMPFLLDPFFTPNAKFSPDGRWIVYESDESGIPEIYVRPNPKASGGKLDLEGKWQVSVSGGTHPQWAENGSSILYVRESGALQRVQVEASNSGIKTSKPEALFETERIGSSSYTFAAGHRTGRILAIKKEESAEPVKIILNWQSRLLRSYGTLEKTQ